MTKILIIGSGGREHAFGWKLSQNHEISTIFYAPGNGGTEENKGINIKIDGTKKENFGKIYEFIINEKVDMAIVGPEVPLVDGIVDYLYARGYYRVFGPSQKASLLESDKFFSYDLMNRLKIPQAESIKCCNINDAKKWIKRLFKNGIVIKARGLTGGKGVYVYTSMDDALIDLQSHFITRNNDILIAERLFGQEFSVFGISDGIKVLPFDVAFQDFKRLKDNDKGPNTGGMGAYGPVPFVSKDILMDICKRILTPIVQELKEMGIIYKGFIYAGMMMTENGPKVLEFNVRFGDPECQPAMMMLKNDLYDLLSRTMDGRLDDDIKFSGWACCVVLASKGYPEYYNKHLPISGLENAERIENVKIFHAGTEKEGNGIYSSGGRVFGITGYSTNNIREARKRAYEAISKIKIPGGFSYRKDIARSH